MLKKLGLMSVLCLAGCGLMPGIENLNTTNMRRVCLPPSINVRPTLIKVTPSYFQHQKEKKYYYRVSPSDVLNINVWEHPEFNILPPNHVATALIPGNQGAAGQTGYLVSPKGIIYFPLVGEVSVKGHTVDTIRKEITHRLAKYIPNPQVNVRVADYRGQKIYVIGEVKNPGLVPINDQILTVADALALTGGIDQNFADPRHIYVIRGSVEHPVIYWLNLRTPDKLLIAEHFDLYPKDILYVSSSPATRWNRMLNQILPSLQNVWYTKVITYT